MRYTEIIVFLNSEEETAQGIILKIIMRVPFNDKQV